MHRPVFLLFAIFFALYVSLPPAAEADVPGSDNPAVGIASYFAQHYQSQKGFEEYELEAARGNLESKFVTGVFYVSGVGGVIPNLPQGLSLIKEASESGNTRAKIVLGYFFIYGYLVPRDVSRGFSLIEAAAREGDATAMFNLAQMYYQGEVTPHDLSKAELWYRKAAEAGVLASMRATSELYRIHPDVPQASPERVFEWARKAAETGDSEGLFLLGRCYHQGIGVPVDLAVAQRAYQRATDGGSVSGMVGYGMTLLDPGTPETDPIKAASLFEKAVEAGSPIAKSLLGEMYLTGHGVLQDVPRGVELVQQIRNSNLPGSARSVGLMCYVADDAGCRVGEAAEKLTEAIKDGDDPDAEFFLALVYQSGKGVAKDVNRAFSLLSSAAKKGSASGQRALAGYYFEGVGTAKNEKLAYYWMRKASDGGDPRAQLGVGECKVDGTCPGISQDVRGGVELIRKAAEAGIYDAKAALGAVYQYGIDGKKDQKRAVALYLEGARAGNQRAIHRLKELGVPVPPVENEAVARRKASESALNPGNWGDLGL